MYKYAHIQWVLGCDAIFSFRFIKKYITFQRKDTNIKLYLSFVDITGDISCQLFNLYGVISMKKYVQLTVTNIRKNKVFLASR